MDDRIYAYIAAFDTKLIEAYSVGALLYSPATNTKLSDKIKSDTFSKPYSLALCLEDTIDDFSVEAGETNIICFLKELFLNRDHYSYIPKIFIRVRHASQISKLFQAMGDAAVLFTGYILPKFSPLNSKQYLSEIERINQISNKTIYFMPILESADLIPLTTRSSILMQIYQELMNYRDYVLNIRVGGNDLCHRFGLRRNSNETIYDIHPVSNIFSDIVTVFHNEFIISGPVWEYFADEDMCWKQGLIRELRMDSLNGFTAKTVIHPNQIEVVNHSLRVNQEDLDDALHILSEEQSELLVSKSSAGTRMNEIKTHTNWAKKQIILADIYGVNE